MAYQNAVVIVVRVEDGFVAVPAAYEVVEHLIPGDLLQAKTANELGTVYAKDTLLAKVEGLLMRKAVDGVTTED